MKYTKIVNEDVEDIINSCGVEFLTSKLKNKTVLITGASGMIGTYFACTLIKLNELYNCNIKIIALVRNKNKLINLIKEHAEIIVQDVSDEMKIEGTVDYIIHSASPASPKIMREHPVETNFANTIGTANTLKLAKEKNSDGYLFVSSREIYGEPIDADTVFTEYGQLGQVNPLVPRNGYAEGKKAAENMCCSFKDEYNLNAKIARLAHTYGPGMSIDDGRVQADFLKNIMNNQDIVLKSDGSSIRTYTYISDAVIAMFLILLKSEDIVYNIANEQDKVSIRQLAEILVEIKKDKNLKLVFDIPKTVDKGTASFKAGILSTEKISNELNWKPKYNIKQGFERTIMHLEEELDKKE